MGHWLNDPPFEDEPQPGRLVRAIRRVINALGWHTPAQREEALEDDPIWDVRKEEAASREPRRDLPDQQHDGEAGEQRGTDPSNVT